MDTLRRQTCTSLNRDADLIAGNATRRVLSARAGSTLPEILTSNTDSLGERKFIGWDNGDEGQSMLHDGFRRLSQVLALSVLVDEPGIVFDHLQWLGSLSPAAQYTDGESAALPYLLDCYSAACEEMLTPQQYVLARAVLVDMLGKRSGDS